MLSNQTMRIALRLRENSPKPITLRQAIRRALWFQEEGRWLSEELQAIAKEKQQGQQPE